MEPLYQMREGTCMRRIFVLTLLVLCMLTVPVRAEDARQKDHAVLSTLLQTAEQAFNSKNFDLLKPYIAKDSFTVVTIDGNKLESLDAFRTYWNDILKDNKTGLERIE